MNFATRVLLVFLCATPLALAAEPGVNFQWGVKIPMRGSARRLDDFKPAASDRKKEASLTTLS